MENTTKIIYLSAIVLIVLAALLIIVYVNPGGAKENMLPTYVIETNTTQTGSNNTSGGVVQNTGGKTTPSGSGYSLFVEISAYLRNYSNNVFAIVEVNLYPIESECIYLIEVNINNYSVNHPLHKYTVSSYNDEPVCSGPFTVPFEIPIQPDYYNEWSIGSKHTLYLKLRIPPDIWRIRLVEIQFVISSEGKSKQTLYIMK